ncbi:hypothetical protein L209DRAFT_305845 [Thermothelomyces heterothallicus CBS 203.75]
MTHRQGWAEGGKRRFFWVCDRFDATRAANTTHSPSRLLPRQGTCTDTSTVPRDTLKLRFDLRVSVLFEPSCQGSSPNTTDSSTLQSLEWTSLSRSNALRVEGGSRSWLPVFDSTTFRAACWFVFWWWCGSGHHYPHTCNLPAINAQITNRVENVLSIPPWHPADLLPTIMPYCCCISEKQDARSWFEVAASKAVWLVAA